MTELLQSLSTQNEFVARHNGPNKSDQQKMLEAINAVSLDSLIDETVPAQIRLEQPMSLAEAKSEADMLAAMREFADQNQVKRTFIGQGYYNTFTPNVILRNVMENPGWYTAYTPYQPEISQGRLEALLNYQQMVMDLTGMEIANASLLDEATAAAEAMTLCKRAGKSKSNVFFVADDVHPQTIEVVKTRAKFIGFEVLVGSLESLPEQDVFGALVQYPGTTGEVRDLTDIIAKAQANKTLVTVATDLLASALLKPAGEMGADVAIGSAQRFGVPMGYGGPHAAFMATRDKHKRTMPGRVIGVSIDTNGNQALRMAMQTREQHIRREKATSNICTAQALLANMASFYAVYHGAEGLRTIARRTHHMTAILAAGLTKGGFELAHNSFFDTITINTGAQTEDLYAKALAADINLRKLGTQLGVSFDETTTVADVEALFAVFGVKEEVAALSTEIAGNEFAAIPEALRRTTEYLTHPVFNTHHSETQMMRYLKQLENKDFSLTHGMIPLGSCTMKLNAAAEMIPVTWPEFGSIHPFAPAEQAAGYAALAKDLKEKLCEITGYDAFSLQPNSGASGEYAGLIAIQRYHESRGEGHRNVCLIPSSAHGTNPATASMVSMKVVVVKCDEEGNIDVTDLAAKIEKHKDNLSSIMITYPSTHGVYEEQVKEVCEMVHAAGGQVYLDGANMNAQVGLTTPGFIGSDVSHLNLHKTFCIPHGGGGPGMGPIGVKSHLAPFLPGHIENGADGENFAVSAADMGSASILPISWAYIAMMGDAGLTDATKVAILNANYVMEQLRPHYPVLYRGSNGRVAHECIIDIRPLKEETGISEEDIAKRLMDYGFHAPTMSFPVAGTLMVEPTESEDLEELDRFCDAMIAIREEMTKVKNGEWPLDNNPLVNAPHTQVDLAKDEWDRPYSRELGCFPSKATKSWKYWPTVNRVDNVYGDRNLICSCPSIDNYED
ncbi:The glycine cleavage system catalyzes the degradation of glycine. The P protein binds the alpha-amino group of glycine through its pyridoxal phosphate cofactor [Vibrio sp. B1ASS3]|uniref:aminomethyl-transferring glycine dehydrogenase n=1 Tax=Vibrio sp. B1ASS3 TaxID=2751176 RepID=UPI001ABA54DB|nr:aminomethyl-transferring glycine dehydrogenase [Vibrio sp. B1ASS3]CAD7825795.1 The glycine cleavage system catalyzes the degradation of glycine. The P protein binds the alpha-amino group of glycine through its pyridoxal phosphate cofactor [Vibrio sp. B1ASS3]CAE6958533.1 The glycine cleavage system catalyzes the degradation of glycine. The P protein binds the alpha-amino group of glycine through its pyridoxal phosphate cofactor [Vibrio sp. B1ASS3]